MGFSLSNSKKQPAQLHYKHKPCLSKLYLDYNMLTIFTQRERNNFPAQPTAFFREVHSHFYISIEETKKNSVWTQSYPSAALHKNLHLSKFASKHGFWFRYKSGI